MTLRRDRVARFAAFAATALIAGSVSLAAGPVRAETYTNRLVNSPDPYLRLHAHNPVDWYPWGPEAFAKAKAENKPIFLSIGYSTCYWCHVAERTIYSDPAIAAVMNKWFVNVKVDREEQPDVDRLYIIATEMLTQRGAWPNNLFLTPDLKPFYAGSYFPPKDEPGGTMGFPTVLAAIHDLWVNHRAEKVDPAADELYGALKKVAAAQRDRKPVPIAPAAWLTQASRALLHSVDPVNGGFGAPSSGAKFPQAPALDLILAAATIDHDVAARDALLKALDGMAYGGIHDQLGGGFHRYSSDPTWTIPHFEKSLADNAQLLSLYARAHALTKEPFLGDVVRDTAGYLLRDMQAPAGGFYTAQDASIDGHEGADYLWTRAEIETALGDAATEHFLAVYEVAAMPEAKDPGSAGVLRIRVPIAETLTRSGARDVPAMLAGGAPERAKLLAVRRMRKQPATDIKVVTGLNGLAIGALAQAGAPEDVAAAKHAADRIWTKAFNADTGALAHAIIGEAVEGDGYVEDYAMLGDGLLDLAAATHDAGDVARATTLADAMLKRFARPDGRLAAGGDNLLVVLADDSDSDVPSGTSAALDLLGRLGALPATALPDAPRFATAAAKLAEAVSGQIAARPTAWPSAIAALARSPLPAAPDAQAAATGPAAPPPDTPPAATPRVPATADHVHVSARIEGNDVAVTLKVDPGYHINAHKPSFDYLVPTALSFAPMKASAVSYPPALRFKSAFAPNGLDVYEGDVPLVAHFPIGVLSGVMGLEGRVTAQACDAKTCLPPATLPVTVANPG